MLPYTPPVDQMRRLMDALGGFGLDRGEGDISPDLFDQILIESARFSSEVLAPINLLGDREGVRFVDGQVRMPEPFKRAYQQFVDAGWCGLRAPENYGGQALPRLVATPVAEMWHAANLSFALCPLLTQSAIETLNTVASEEIKARYLPKLISGAWSGTMNLTEPQAGTDLSKIRTRAEPFGDHYRIFGQKIFITYGEHDLTENILHLVLARIPGAAPGLKGLSLFLVPKILLDDTGALDVPNDVRCLSIERKLGIHASPTCVMSYGDQDGAVGFLVGEIHQGVSQMFVMMNAARFSVGLQGVGIAERAYQAALYHAQNRIQGSPVGQPKDSEIPIIEHPDVRRMLMRMKARIAAGRGLQYFTALEMDRSHDPDMAIQTTARERVDLLTPLIKAWNTEMAEEVTSISLQVHGGAGYIEDTGVAQLLRDARITTLYEGTTGIQANDLLIRKVLKNEGRVLRELLTEWRTAVAGDVWAPAVLEDVDELMALIDTWVQEYQDPRRHPEIYVNAVPFMRALGTILGGLLLLKVLPVALDTESETSSEEIVTRYYLEAILPEAAGLLRSLYAGGETVLALPREAF